MIGVYGGQDFFNRCLATFSSRPFLLFHLVASTSSILVSEKLSHLVACNPKKLREYTVFISHIITSSHTVF